MDEEDPAKQIYDEHRAAIEHDLAPVKQWMKDRWKQVSGQPN